MRRLRPCCLYNVTEVHVALYSASVGKVGSVVGIHVDAHSASVVQVGTAIASETFLPIHAVYGVYVAPIPEYFEVQVEVWYI